jgi:hypothetical protein
MQSLEEWPAADLYVKAGDFGLHCFEVLKYEGLSEAEATRIAQKALSIGGPADAGVYIENYCENIKKQFQVNQLPGPQSS